VKGPEEGRGRGTGRAEKEGAKLCGKIK